ncbi:hypothetical protein F5I97DRAFT_1934898 [Phlebopus sp. FC_14]|nr:hypothetical protein F5I97DRAFT_1934898 [Phlebopus sp. FC_14]
MLPADLDDEQRADIAHEHPIDVESGPSSPSSGLPSYLQSPRFRAKSSKSASRHRSHTTTEGSSSQLLARLIARDEQVREVNALLVVTSDRLEAESTRANDAERRALDYFNRLRSVQESRERAEQESARLREELKLYKLQLENAQKEIFRAQDIINQVSAQRNEAEADAARARTKARKLQEEKLVMLAREEGRRQGYKEGLSMGRRVGYDEGRAAGRAGVGSSTRSRRYALTNEDGDDDDDDGDENQQDDTEEERVGSRTELRSRYVPASRSCLIHSARSEPVPPIRTYDTAPHAATLPVPTLVTPLPIRSPSHEPRAISPVDDPGEPETILPIPIRTTPSVPNLPTDIPADGWIPEADPHTAYIQVPAPHGLSRPVPTTPKEPRSYPPVRSRDYAYEPPVPIPVPRPRSPSIISRSSTHVSQYDLVSAPKRSTSSLRNEIYAGRARSGSQPTRGTVSRNEGREHEHEHHPHHHHPTRGQADDMVEQWRADPDVVSTATPTRNQASPEAGARSHTPIPMEPTATQPQAPEALQQQQQQQQEETSPTRVLHSPLEYLRERFRQRPSSSTSIPNIVVESPTDSASNPSPAGTTVTRPELLSPESANRPLPSSKDDHDDHQHRQHQHQTQQQPSTSSSASSSHQYQYQPRQPPSGPPPQQHKHQANPYHHYLYDAAYRSKTPNTTSAPWTPAGFVPLSSGKGGERHDVYRHHVRSVSTPTPAPMRGVSGGGSSTGLGAGRYEAAPLPPGVTYPEPPIRPHTSHYRRHGAREDDDGGEGERGELGGRERGTGGGSGSGVPVVAQETQESGRSGSAAAAAFAPSQRPMSDIDDDLRVRSF